jgi:hypothetical protein
LLPSAMSGRELPQAAIVPPSALIARPRYMRSDLVAKP